MNTKWLLALIAIVPGFLTLLILIWRWYDIRLTALDHQVQQKQENAPAKSTTNPK